MDVSYQLITFIGESKNLRGRVQLERRVIPPEIHHTSPNLPCNIKTKVVFHCIGLILKRNFCFDVNGRFESTWCITLYAKYKFYRLTWNNTYKGLPLRPHSFIHVIRGVNVRDKLSPCLVSPQEVVHSNNSHIVWKWRIIEDVDRSRAPKG